MAEKKVAGKKKSASKKKPAAKKAAAKKENLGGMASPKTDDEFFRGVSQIEAVLNGEPARLPVFYYDNSCITAIFAAPLAKLRRILPKKDYHPLPVAPGVGAISITAFNYRDTDIRPYNEISIAVLMSYWDMPLLPGAGLVQSLVKNEFHAYVHHLPVTTETARVGGVDIYNLPKFVARIDYEDTEDGVFVELSENDEMILSMRAKKINAASQRTLRFVVYPVKEGRAQIANCLMNAQQFGMSVDPGSVELELGADHPIARELDDLLLFKKPFFYMYVPKFQAILYGPSVLE